MDRIARDEVRGLKEKLYPFTLSHIIYFIIVTGLTMYITGWFLKYRLIRWIYVGTIIVITASIWQGGKKEDAIENIFKLATI
jgi:hypothetical protein